MLISNSQSKAQPKSAAAVKATTNGASVRGGRGLDLGGRNDVINKRKTADELDAEMVDYFDAPNGDGTVNGNAQAAANDDGMDEISVGISHSALVCDLLTCAIVIGTDRR